MKLKWKEIKQILDGLTEEELEKDAIVIDRFYDSHNEIDEFKIADRNWYYDENIPGLIDKFDTDYIDIDEWLEIIIKEGDWYFLV